MKLAKSTFWASVVYMLPPLWFLWSGWLEMNSPEWGTNDSGAVQGYAFFTLASFAALTCVIVIFPGIAKLLGATFTSRKWVYLNIAAIALIAFIAAVIFGFMVDESSLTGIFISAAVLSIPLTILCLILLAPAMYIWLRIAKSTHNNNKQRDGQTLRVRPPLL